MGLVVRVLLCSLLTVSCTAPPVCNEATGKCVRFDLEERGKTDREDKAEDESSFWVGFFSALLILQGSK